MGAVPLCTIADLQVAVQVGDGTTEQQVAEGVPSSNCFTIFHSKQFCECIGLLF